MRSSPGGNHCHYVVQNFLVLRKKTSYLPKMSRRCISLFSGAMGLDLGLEAAGLKTAIAVEKNKMAVATIKLNRGDSFPVIDRAIEEVQAAEILRLAGIYSGEAFVVTGGPCCQSFSTAGKRRSFEDTDRGQLFRHFKRIVLEARPRFFVMENVKGMLSAAVRHRSLNERGAGFPPLGSDEELGSALKVIRKELAELNYRVIFGLVNCADYGVPQKRYRVIFIGSRDGEEISLPPPTHAKDGEGALLPWVTLKDAIQDLDDPNAEFVPFSDDRTTLLSHLSAGQNWHNLPKHLHRTALGAAADTWGGRSGFCRRLSWHEPSPTLTTDPNGRATTLCHPRKLRPLTVSEYAALQQFPTDWVFAGSTGQKYVQIGNAVPLGLGTAIGRSLLATVRRTSRDGLPNNAQQSLGTVLCADETLEKRIASRRRTQLHPVRYRKNSDPEAARKWMSLVAA